MLIRRSLRLCATLILITGPSALAQCPPQWSDKFSSGEVFDHRSPNSRINASAVFDDGSGPRLFLGGSFTRAGGMPAYNIAAWDGARWHAPGPVVETFSSDSVNILLVFDDGTGPQLYAGGNFLQLGGAPASRIARWDGDHWSQVGAGFNGDVDALAIYDNGNGPRLYAGGAFTSSGAAQTSYIARWNGASWESVNTQMRLNQRVRALVAHNEPTGPVLVAGGDFTRVGDWDASHLAFYAAAGNWMPLPTLAVNQPVYALASIAEGPLAGLYVGGQFTQAGDRFNRVSAPRLARWREYTWTAPGEVMGDVSTILPLDDSIIVAGEFPAVSGVPATRFVARWNGAWSSLADGIPFGTDRGIYTLCPLPESLGSGLAVGGRFPRRGDLQRRQLRHLRRRRMAPPGQRSGPQPLLPGERQLLPGSRSRSGLP